MLEDTDGLQKAIQTLGRGFQLDYSLVTITMSDGTTLTLQEFMEQFDFNHQHTVVQKLQQKCEEWTAYIQNG